MSWSDRRLSKFISLLLRHRPEEIGLELEPGGWASLAKLARKSRKEADASITEGWIRELVASQGKPRFSISGDGERIRANYGHSIDVDLDLTPSTPPPILYHGTADRTLQSILREGLKPGSRPHVHLSADPEDARTVGQRHGTPRVLRVDAVQMSRRGHQLYQAGEGIWLTGFVPPEHIAVVDG